MIIKNIIKFVFFLSACLLSLTLFAQTSQELESQVKQYKQGTKPISVVMIDHGKKIKVLDGVKMQSVIPIGELSQLFTVLLLTKEIDQGRMQLDDLVGRYLPHSMKRFKTLSLMQLATLNNELDATASMSLLAKILSKRNKDHYWNLLHRKVLNPLHLNSAKKVQNLNPAVDGMGLSIKDLQATLAIMIGLEELNDDWLYPVRMTQVDYWQNGLEQRALVWRSLPASAHILADDFPLQTQAELTAIDEDPALFDETRLFEKNAQSQQYQLYIAVRPDQQSGVLILAEKSYKSNELAQLGRHLLIN